SNWSNNLWIPLSDWHFETSCCRDAVVSMRIVEVANLIATALFAFSYIRILRTTKILHVNLRLLFWVSVLNDLLLLSVRVFDIINVSGLLDENEVLTFFKYNCWYVGLMLPSTIVLERIYAIRNFKTYENTLFYYIHYTKHNVKQIMEIRYRLMANTLTSRYQVIEAQRSVSMLIWYIPYQAFMTILMIVLIMVIRAVIQNKFPREYLLGVQM
ncbi:hypothetical protein PMAYCL1PPCAC_16122, partial [Pristionchus mayeri]